MEPKRKRFGSLFMGRGLPIQERPRNFYQLWKSRYRTKRSDGFKTEWFAGVW